MSRTHEGQKQREGGVNECENDCEDESELEQESECFCHEKGEGVQNAAESKRSERNCDTGVAGKERDVVVVVVVNEGAR